MARMDTTLYEVELVVEYDYIPACKQYPHAPDEPADAEITAVLHEGVDIMALVGPDEMQILRIRCLENHCS